MHSCSGLSLSQASLQLQSLKTLECSSPLHHEPPHGAAVASQAPGTLSQPRFLSSKPLDSSSNQPRPHQEYSFTTPHTFPLFHLSYLEIKSPGTACSPPCRAWILISCISEAVLEPSRALFGLRWSRIAPGPGKDGMQSSTRPSSAAGTAHSAAGARAAWLPPWTWKCSKCCAKLGLHTGVGAVIPGLSLSWECWEKQETLRFVVVPSLQKNQT